MKRLVISDRKEDKLPGGVNLHHLALTSCIGCWSCWLKHPGKCVFSDGDDLLRAYMGAKEVHLILRPVKGQLSARMKDFIDRLIPLFLPYISLEEGGCNHLPRYETYPEVAITIDQDDATPEELSTLKDYLKRTFTQYRSQVTWEDEQ